MRARGRGMTWWARTAQKSGSRLLPNAAVPVWLSSALRTSAMAPEKKLAPKALVFFFVECRMLLNVGLFTTYFTTE